MVHAELSFGRSLTTKLLPVGFFLFFSSLNKGHGGCCSCWLKGNLTGPLHKSTTFTNYGIVLEREYGLSASTLLKEFISKAVISVRFHRTATPCSATQQMPLYTSYTVAFSELK